MPDLSFRRRDESVASEHLGLPGPADLALDALESLAAAVLVTGPDKTIFFSNPAARRLGLGGRGAALPPMLANLAASARAGHEAVVRQLILPSPDDLPIRLRRERSGPSVRGRAHALGPEGFVVLVLEDLTDALRVEAVRRDFVANVSHELKTPVGAMQLLAEALHDASDDPAAVRHFAERMTIEARRLGSLVQELIDLSRLQGAEPARDQTPVPIGRVVAEAVDRNGLQAGAKQIRIAVVPDSPQVTAQDDQVDTPDSLLVYGVETHLTTAIVNLIENAIAYSPEHTRVIVGMRRRNDAVEVSVADEGIGIAESDQERIFERFYRVDPARSRATGGTGLGLAIVKHIATNHGGEVVLWSADGEGSTFTLRLPAYVPDDHPQEEGNP